MRRLVLTLLLGLALVVPATQPAHADAKSRYQAQAVAATNAQRTAAGLARLVKQDCVQRFARRQAVRMAKQRRMFHQDLGPVLRTCRLSMVGENVAVGFPSGRAVVTGWMRSPGHRANILEPRYRLLGLAARRAGGRWYAVQVFGRA
ncbi:CAP domain-containing protein [Nocardioides sp. SYSU D00038]|uniref:CAP domain-containing protein n=1 Tax=Nocardioides sp. SYSU D00038 TaxID=2812554 RepID=UPI0019678D0C|nr:CAP domain-containing protein [Nocardioides sp. SYSU D00038]